LNRKFACDRNKPDPVGCTQDLAGLHVGRDLFTEGVEAFLCDGGNVIGLCDDGPNERGASGAVESD
jgi:hypothetical protein